MAVIAADPYQEGGHNDLNTAPQQLAGFEETPVHASDTMYCYLIAKKGVDSRLFLEIIFGVELISKRRQDSKRLQSYLTQLQ